MEIITFYDMLTHYQLKISEALDYLLSVQSKLDAASDCAETAWRGSASNAFGLKLDELRPEAKKAQEALEQSLTALSVIRIKALEQGIV